MTKFAAKLRPAMLDISYAGSPIVGEHVELEEGGLPGPSTGDRHLDSHLVPE